MEATVSRVIRADVREPDDVYIVYEPYGEMAPNLSLVFGVKTEGEFDEQGNFISAAHEKEKRKKLEALVKGFEKDASEQLGLPVRAFLY